MTLGASDWSPRSPLAAIGQEHGRGCGDTLGQYHCEQSVPTGESMKIGILAAAVTDFSIEALL